MLPGCRQTLEKGIQVSIVARSKMRRLPRGKFSKVMLNGSDLLQEAQRVELRCYLSKAPLSSPP